MSQTINTAYLLSETEQETVTEFLDFVLTASDAYQRATEADAYANLQMSEEIVDLFRRVAELHNGIDHGVAARKLSAEYFPDDTPQYDA